MTKEESVNYFHSLLKFGVMPGLDRIYKLLDILGNPQDKLKFVHVAGTNGKGSTCTMISNILRSAGYRTGLYTSPYVIDFSERIQINNKNIPGDMLSYYTEKVESAIKDLNDNGIVITEFEAITAVAFLYFAGENCDIVVLETGLGGRFDATNVIKSNICSIITSISLDHTKVLGNTIAEISKEKCGIIKRKCPLIINPSQPDDFLSVASETAQELESQIYIADENSIFVNSDDITGSDFKFENTEIHLPFCGKHQIKNVALVLSAVEILRENGFIIWTENVKQGIEQSFIPARVEVISRNPLVILDGCHNPDSTKALADILNEYLSGKKLIGLTAMMGDKDCRKNLENLAPLFTDIICTVSSNSRSSGAEELKKICSEYCNSVAIEDNTYAVKTAINNSAEYDGLIVFGSLYFAADVRERLKQYYKKEE